MEHIELQTQSHTLSIGVRGQGVSPRMLLDPNPADGIIDVGVVAARESIKKEIKLVNTSQFPVHFQINLLRQVCATTEKQKYIIHLGTKS